MTDHETMGSNEIWRPSQQQSWQDASATQIFGAAVLLALVRVLLGALGFHRTIRLVRRLSRGQQRDQIREVELAAAAYRVAAAAAFMPVGRSCLERSLVLFYLLKRNGAPVVLRLGANAHPFAAHAWVEYNGQPVNEHRESIEDYSPIFEVR